jgi:hypothetical protein
LRIIRLNRACADDHGVVQRAQSMQMNNVLLIVDEIGVAARRCDVTIETLSQMTQQAAGCWLAKRQIQIDQRLRGRKRRQPLTLLPGKLPDRSLFLIRDQPAVPRDSEMPVNGRGEPVALQAKFSQQLPGPIGNRPAIRCN